MSRPRNGPLLTPEQVLEKYTSGPKSGVFTDGACEGNPGPGGWGYVRVEDDRIVAQGHGSDPATTNNRMELMALIEAFRALPADARVTVFSDSELCVKTINEWAAAWERRGWKRKTGPIANLELVQTLYRLAGAHPHVELRWIKAHDGSRWNEYVDALANTFLREREAARKSDRN
jgi:ribonuclease HI